MALGNRRAVNRQGETGETAGMGEKGETPETIGTEDGPLAGMRGSKPQTRVKQ
jgi:hypothetical protein